MTGGRIVDLATVSNVRVDWAAHDELDQNAPDDRIVAQALHALVDDRSRLEVVSHNIRPLNMAKAYGLRHVAATRELAAADQAVARQKPDTDAGRRIAGLPRHSTAAGDQPRASRGSTAYATPRRPADAGTGRQTGPAGTSPCPRSHPPGGLHAGDRPGSCDARRRRRLAREGP